MNPQLHPARQTLGASGGGIGGSSGRLRGDGVAKLGTPPLTPTRVTPATLVSSNELRCLSALGTYGLADEDMASLLSNATSSPPPSLFLRLVRFGITLNGVDITLPSGAIPPLLPPELLVRPPPTPPLPPPPTSATNTSAANTSAANSSASTEIGGNESAGEAGSGLSDLGSQRAELDADAAEVAPTPTTISGIPHQANYAPSPLTAAHSDAFAVYDLPYLSHVTPTGSPIVVSLATQLPTSLGLHGGALRRSPFIPPAV